jgi:hypothetical protein
MDVALLTELQGWCLRGTCGKAHTGLWPRSLYNILVAIVVFTGEA